MCFGGGGSYGGSQKLPEPAPVPDEVPVRPIEQDLGEPKNDTPATASKKTGSGTGLVIPTG